MFNRALTKTLPLLPFAGTFGVFSACGCGNCPACLGASASVVGLAMLIGSKKLLSSLRQGEAEGDGGKHIRRCEP